MTTGSEVVVGLDLGTTSSKALVRDLLGRQVALVEARTPWMTVDAGTETTPQAMLGLAVDLLARVAQAAELRSDGCRCSALASPAWARAVCFSMPPATLCAGDRLVRPTRGAAGAAGRRAGRDPAGAVRAAYGPAVGLPVQPGQAAVAGEQRLGADTGAPVGERAGVGRAPARRVPGPGAVARVPDRARRPGHRRTMAGGRLGGRPAHDTAAATGLRGNRRGLVAVRRPPDVTSGCSPDRRRPRPPSRGHRCRRCGSGRAVQLVGHSRRRRPLPAWDPRRQPSGSAGPVRPVRGCTCYRVRRCCSVVSEVDCSCAGSSVRSVRQGRRNETASTRRRSPSVSCPLAWRCPARDRPATTSYCDCGTT